jgi:hypothetical protein
VRVPPSFKGTPRAVPDNRHLREDQDLHTAPSSPSPVRKTSLVTCVLLAPRASIFLHPTFSETVACPRHGWNSTLRLYSSTMLGACLIKSQGAIYSRSQTSSRWLSNDTVTTWSRGPADMCTIKGDDFISCLATSLSLVHQWCLSPPQSHMATVTSSIRRQLVVFWVAKESPITVDPWPCSLRNKTKPDHVSEGPAPSYIYIRRWLHDLPLWPDVYSLHLLWLCT